MAGDVAAALARLKQLFDVGADPSVVLEDLAAFTHLVTRLKLAPSAAEDEALTPEERTRGAAFAEKLSIRALARAWQMLLKGIEETHEASRPLAAADMVIVRLAHAADLPTPDEALRSLRGNGGASPTPVSAPPSAERGPRMATSTPAAAAPAARYSAAPQAASAPRTAPTAHVASFADVVALAGQQRELKLKHDLETVVRLIRFEPGKIEVALTEHASPALVGELSKKLEEWTGTRWMIAVAREGGAPTIAEVRQNAQARLVDDARADPLVAAVLQTFPGAEIVDVRVRGDAVAAPPLDRAMPPIPDENLDDDTLDEDD
jgi:DNA polymerase-3 subunit gamma/tau